MPKRSVKKKRKSRRAKRGVHHSPKCPTPINYRSSWELKYALWLDANASVASYRYEPFVIEYVANVRTGRKRRYWPDFEVTHVDGSMELVEIKPKRKLTLLANVKKFAAARVYCEGHGLTWVVVTEAELKSLGLM